MIALLWRMTRGYRLRPWRSPYLRWRLETYWGLSAGSIGFRQFWSFVWRHRAELLRYGRWAARMDRAAREDLTSPQRRRDTENTLSFIEGSGV